jgi:succinyl-CoA synthetase alpha subunit
MSVLVNKDSKVIIQGFTGKGGQTHLGKPVFNTIEDAVKEVDANITLIFVPPAFAADAVMEAAQAGIKVIICITEGIPTKDMIMVKEYLSDKDSILVGPNCPGVITPEEAKCGIMPGFVFKKGRIGVVSKSGTLTYEAADQVVKAGLGVSTAIGVGGDPIIGTTILDAVKLFMNDDQTDGIVMIGEIGGQLEVNAAKWIQKNGTKPVVGFIAGQTAPKGRTMGHAGAIVGGKDDTAEAKMRILSQCGVHVVESPANIGAKIAELVGVSV